MQQRLDHAHDAPAQLRRKQIGGNRHDDRADDAAEQAGDDARGQQ